MHRYVQQIRSQASGQGRIAFVSGNFNIVHPGHLRLLKFAADTADMLVVAVNPDSTPGVSVPGSMRLEGVRALSIVNYAFLLECPLSDLLAELRPDFVVKGKEFETAFNPEAAVVASYGGKLIFSSGDVQFASLDLIRHELTHEMPPPLLRSAFGFPERHGLNAQSVRRVLREMSGLRVAVIGDIIIDDYIVCDPLGMSQEDPTIVVSPLETQTFVGGAGIVAAHARSFGAEAHLFTVFGEDATAQFAQEKLNEAGVEVHGILDASRPTTRKQRYRAVGKTLLRVNHLRQHAIGKELVERMYRAFSDALARVDLVMFSDFNYGCLPQPLVDAIAAAAGARRIPVSADSQASSQMSDIARFKGMTLITPTEREARLAMRDTASGLAVLASDLRNASQAENVVITLGGNGMMVYGRNSGGEYMTDLLPALNPNPQDVAGAGDSLFTAASMALCAGADVWLASYLGGIAAAVQVSRIGNTPLDVNDVLFELDQIDRQ